jgi:DNA-binding HxlR family transcriptional regulator
MEMMNKVMEWLNGAMNAPVLMSVAIGIEFALRMFKSEKPLSIAYMVSDGLKKVGEICSKVGALMDKVLPQRLK